MSDVSLLTVLGGPRAKSVPSYVNAPVSSPVSLTPDAPTGGQWLDGSIGTSIAIASVAAGLVYGIVSKLSSQKHRSSPSNAGGRQQSRAGSQAASPSPVSIDEDDLSSPVHEESIAKFCKMEELGRGAFGVVFKGRHFRTGELVAIKEMSADGGEELRAEYQMVVGLQHPNIVNVLDFELGQRHARLYLEWVAGGSLADSIKKFPFDEHLARNYVRQILSGLNFLHEHNLLHRDIKPRNILIDHKGVLKLTDFGLSRHMDSIHDHTRNVAGTVVYMAPECLKGSFSAASDIWAVGATLSEMLTRQTPWSHIDPQIFRNQTALIYHIAHFQGHKGHHPVIPRNVSAECQAFMEICFAQRVEDRLSCQQLLQHAWFTSQAEEESLQPAQLATSPPATCSPRQSNGESPSSHQCSVNTTHSQRSNDTLQ